MIGTLVNKSELCVDTFEYTFKLAEPISFRAGQYVFLTFKKPKFSDYQGSRRYFTIASSPVKKDIITVATRLRDSGFKKELHQLPIGGIIDVSDPDGDLVFPETSDHSLVFIAGGIGVNPFMSMLRYMSELNLHTPVTLIYSNKMEETTPYFSELRDLDKKLKNFQLVMTMTKDNNWKGRTGRVNIDMIKQHVTEPMKTVFYIVGPEKMGQTIEENLIELDINDDFIKREDFAGY